MAAKPRAEKIAPGVIRVAQPPFKNSKGRLDGIPVTLTLPDDAGDAAVGIMAPAARTPWGCLFFTLLAACILLAVWSSRLAALSALIGLIAFYTVFNLPSRKTADDIRRVLLMVSHRQGKRARSALRGPLRRDPDGEGVNYIAALVEIVEGNHGAALEHLAVAARAMDRFAEFHHMTGRCHAAIGDGDEARASFERALTFGLYPSDPIVRREIAALESEESPSVH